MAAFHLDPPLVPRDGRVLRVITIARISTLNQDPKSLADQEAVLHKWVKDRFDGPVEWRPIAGQGSGESIDRKQVAEAEELVDAGRHDLVLMEDLSRHMRRIHAMLFCEQCEDRDVRLIAVNDGIDTFKEWRLNAFFAAMKHEQSNKDTSDRIKRTLRNRFQYGDVVQCTIYGYVKPPGMKNDSEFQKDPAAEPIYREWFSRLDRGDTFAEVADWLNASNVAPGPYCRRRRWEAAMVARITRNPILKGLRIRNRMKSKRNNKTGRYRSIKAPPEELLERFCSHLAFFDTAYYDRVVAKVNARNAKFRRGKDGPDPRCDVPRKRTRYPGQAVYCGICGRVYVYGGHGQIGHLICSGVRHYHCWNTFTLDGPLAAQKISQAAFAEIESLPGFDPAFLALVNDEGRRLDGARELRLREIETAIASRQRQAENLLKFIRDGGDSAIVREDMRRLEQELTQLRYEQGEIVDTPSQTIEIPSADDLRQLAREAFEGLSLDSFEFAKLLRRLVGKIYVFPFQLCDGGHPVLRGQGCLQIANLLPERHLQQVLANPLRRMIQVDLFEPPQRAVYRKEIMARRAAGETEAKVARSLGLTITAAQRASALGRLMKQRGLSDPYVPLTAPPPNAERFRHHLHPRYRFEPLPGERPAWQS